MSNGNCILANGYPLPMAYRKEYRMMTDDERRRWHFALQTMKRNGEYDRFAREHQSVSVKGIPSASYSCAFMLTQHVQIRI